MCHALYAAPARPPRRDSGLMLLAVQHVDLQSLQQSVSFWNGKVACKGTCWNVWQQPDSMCSVTLRAPSIA